MSTTDQHHDAAGTRQDKHPLPPAEPDTTPDENTPWIIGFFFVAGLLISFFIGWIVFPELLYSKKQQPISFNHAVHMDLVNDGCASCHYFREDGSFSGLPDNSSCVDCHQFPMGVSEDEERYATEYVEQNREVDWLSYARQPECVFFSHAAHVKGAGMDCAECHGDVASRTESRVYQENRLTGYSRDIWGHSISRLRKPGADEPKTMKMNDCARCHQAEMGYKGACFQCHK
jgi:menaquinone reductase, multiheme cytochrome c subunit